MNTNQTKETDMQVVIPMKVARAVFDCAVESLDFGSGFLNDEEVEALRAYAVLIGVDPWDATPSNFMPKYCPGHVWTEWKQNRYSPTGESRHCTICHQRETQVFTGSQ